MQLFKNSQKVVWAMTAAMLISVSPFTAFAGKSQPLPEVEKIKVNLKTSEDAVEMMYVSSDIKVDDTLKGKLTSQVDVLKVEIDAMWNLINDKSMPASEKEITYVRYTMGDKRVDEALIAALKAGIKIRVLTDFNPVMSYGKFKKGEKFTIDFKNADLRNNGKGSGPETITRLTDGGFVLGKNLLSQPIYNPEENERTPIMHEKALLMRAGKKVTSFISTTNAAPHVRFNRIFKFVLDEIYGAYYAHVDALTANYKAGKETKELAPSTRKQFECNDGSFIQLAFTDGKFNPNDRIVEAVTNGDLKDWVISAFAPTDWSVMEALGTKMAADKDSGNKDAAIKGFVVTDVKFTNNYGYGLTATLSNYSVFSQYVNRHGFGEGVAKRVDAYVWHQSATDPETGKQLFQTEEDGAPNYAVLWHDKTTILKYKDGSADLFSGSFNLSGNVVNAENQLQIRLRSDSALVRATDYSIRETVRTNPNYAVPINESMVSSALAKTFKIGDLDIGDQDVRDLIQAVRDQHEDAVIALLRKISQSETHMKAPLSKEERSARVDTFAKFLGWYYKALPQWQDPLVGLKHTLAVGLILANDKMSVGTRVAILRDAVWRPKLSPADLQKFLEQAYAVLGYGKLPPPPPKRGTDDEKKKPKGASTEVDERHGDSEAATLSHEEAAHAATTAAIHPVVTTAAAAAQATAPLAPAPELALVSAAPSESGLLARVKSHFKALISPATDLDAAPAVQAPAAAAAAPLKSIAPPAQVEAPLTTVSVAAQSFQQSGPAVIEGVRDLRVLNGIARTDITIFDFDNTVMNLPTKIRLFKKGSEEFMDVSSAEYAAARTTIGFETGKYANYEVRKGEGANKDNSFIHFNDGSFPSDIKAALATPDHGKAAGFDALVERLRDRRSAARTYFNTARGHKPEVFMAGLRLIKTFVAKTQGINIFLPAKTHVIEVGYATDVPSEKAKRNLELLSKVKKMGGVKKVILLDDDIHNVNATNEAARAPLNKKALMGLNMTSLQVLPSDLVINSAVPAQQAAAPRVFLCKDLFH